MWKCPCAWKGNYKGAGDGGRCCVAGDCIISSWGTNTQRKFQIISLKKCWRVDSSCEQIQFDLLCCLCRGLWFVEMKCYSDNDRQHAGMAAFPCHPASAIIAVYFCRLAVETCIDLWRKGAGRRNLVWIRSMSWVVSELFWYLSWEGSVHDLFKKRMKGRCLCNWKITW